MQYLNSSKSDIDRILKLECRKKGSDKSSKDDEKLLEKRLNINIVYKKIARNNVQIHNSIRIEKKEELEYETE